MTPDRYEFGQSAREAGQRLAWSDEHRKVNLPRIRLEVAAEDEEQFDAAASVNRFDAHAVL